MNSEIRELLAYVQHKDECTYWQDGINQSPSCDCGLAELTAKISSTLSTLEPTKGFDWGEFQPPFLYSEALGTIRDREGRLVAFVSWHPIGRHITALMNGEGKSE